MLLTLRFNIVMQLEVCSLLREAISHSDEAPKLGTQRTWMPTLFLPLHSSVMPGSYFASPGFSFLIFKMEVKIIAPSSMVMKKNAVNTYKRLRKVSVQHRISI